MSQGPQIWGKMFLFCAGPSQKSPFPHVQTESNCSCHWFKLKWECAGVGERGTPSALGGRVRLLALGRGGEHRAPLPVSSDQALLALA